jgi:electron transfer flavoprotein alpha subunit
MLEVGRPMRIVALVKQIPAFEELELGDDGRLRREGLDLEMNPYCRRAVSQAVALAAGHPDCSVTFVTLGPPSAEDVLREALAWAIARSVPADAILVTDRAFAGSDTLATAQALAATLEREGPFDLAIVGLNSVDSDTGQVGPELAELTGLPFLTGVRELRLDGSQTIHARCEYDDGWVEAEVDLPALISVAERLIEPCKVDAAERLHVPSELVRVLRGADLGPGPWGAEGSPTRVGSVRLHEVSRERLKLDGPITEQVTKAYSILARRGALDPGNDGGGVDSVPSAHGISGPPIGVAVEPDRPWATQELLGAAAQLARAIDGHVVALGFASEEPRLLASQGADALVAFTDAAIGEDASRAVVGWATEHGPWAVLASSTAWGREVMARAAASLCAGLTGDAVALEVGADGRLVAWKPAFSGQLVAAITATSPVQMATVRVGVLPRPVSREVPAAIPVSTHPIEPLGRVRVLSRQQDDQLETLAEASVVIGVGTGVQPDEYEALQSLRDTLGAELGATRKVTDNGWMPRARQVGITGRTISPRLYIAIGVGGKFNHMVGVRSAGTVLAINSDPHAAVFAAADVGIVGNWQEVVPLLVDAITADESLREDQIAIGSPTAG